MPEAPEPQKTIVKLLRLDPHPVLVTDLETRCIVGANDAAYEILGRVPPILEGVPVTEVVAKEDWPAVQASMDLLASKAVEGYRAVRSLRRGNGQKFTARIWARAANVDEHMLNFVGLEIGDGKIAWPSSNDRITIAGIVTDHDWIIEMVSSDIGTILGLSPESYEGSPLLGLLQPWDVQKLMSAVGRVTSDGGGATLRVHMRNSAGHWQEVLLLVVALCRDSPPRLGLAITSPHLDVGTKDSHRQLAVRGGDAIDGADQFRLCSPPERFSTRQSEILTRLIRGERVNQIAEDLYLSPSTVRNHLTAIYRKFGVHSQAELLTKLLRSAAS